MKFRSFLIPEAAQRTEGLKPRRSGEIVPRYTAAHLHFMRVKIDLFAIDTLVNMLASAGLHIEIPDWHRSLIHLVDSRCPSQA